MNADGVDIFDKANGDDVVLSVSYDFKLKLFPAADALLNKHLTDKACLETSFAYDLQLINIIHHTAACAAHSVSGAENNGIFELFSDLNGFVNGICHLAACHFNAEAVHSVLELNSVLATLDSVHLNADDLYIVLVENACLGKLGAEVKTRLTAEIGQQCIGTLLFDYLSESL